MSSTETPALASTRPEDEWVDFNVGYQPAFDGLRGLGVSTFILYHGIMLFEETPRSWFLPGAFLWLEMFFVQSGFLITALMLEEWRRNGLVSLRNFYARRAIRLFPVLLVVVGLTAVFLLTLSEHKGLSAPWTEVWGGLFYVQNWLNAYRVNAFPFYLSHLWSLSVEEQFYLVAPIGMILLLRARVPLRKTILLLGVGAVLSAAWMAYLERGVDDHWEYARLYYATDTRAQGFFVGMMLACAASAGLVFRRPDPSRVRTFAGWAGAAVLLVLLFTSDLRQGAIYRGGFLLCDLAVVAILVEIISSPRAFLARILRWEPLRFMGMISYGLYLWHWPIMHVVRQYFDGDKVPTIALQISLTAIVAVASYYLLERPVSRRLAPRFARIQPAGAGAGRG